MFASFQISDVPGLAEHLAKKRYQTAAEREAAFLGKTHTVCGVKLRAMTVLDFTLLSHINSPILNNGNPTLQDVFMFMWILRKKPGRWFRSIRAWCFGRWCGRLNPEKAALDCLEYVERMFADIPASPAGEASEPNSSLIASWCHVIMSSYSQYTEQMVLDMPLPKLWQYLRNIKQDKNPGAPEQNRSVDQIINGILNGLNRKEFTAEDLLEGRVDLGLN